MTVVRRLFAIALAVLLVAPMAQAQTHVIGRAALDKAVQNRVDEEQADRDAIVTLLRRPEVRQIAAKAGLPVDRAETAVSMLRGDDLREIASEARRVQTDLAGGASNIVISTTTVIIILLVVILIVVIAD